MNKIVGVGLCLLIGLTAVAKDTASDGIVDSLEELRDLFEEHQSDWVPLSLPGDVTLFQDYGLVVPFRANKLPKAFCKQLIGEYNADGIPLYRITCIEDFETREVVIYDTIYETILWRLEADPFHDPYAFLRWKFGLSVLDSFDGIHPQEILRLDSAKIAADFILIPHLFYEEYVLAEEQHRLDEAAALAAMPMMMAFSQQETVTNLTVGISGNGGEVELELKWPGGFTNRLEVFSCQNLLSNQWNIASSKLPTFGFSSLNWTNAISTNSSTYFYRSGDSDADWDGDTISDARERIMLGTDPFLADSDGDLLEDNEEVRLQTYAIEPTIFEWVDIELPENSITNWTGGLNDGYAFAELGFEFNFYDNIFSNTYVGINGLLRFGSPTTENYNRHLPDTLAPSNLVAVLWDDLRVDTNSMSMVYMAALGTEPDRRIVITWKNMRMLQSYWARLTFQVELQEDGGIIFRYSDLQGSLSSGSSATTGMQDGAGEDGTIWSYNVLDSLTNGLAIRFLYAPTFSQTTDPNDWDTDDDGMDDGFESNYSYLDPNDPSDGAEDDDYDGLSNLLEYQIGTLLYKRDSDNDRLSDWNEYYHGLDPAQALPSDMAADSDGDGMTNGYEVANSLDAFDASDKYLDRDSDGLNNYLEYINGLSAINPDTDHDGLNDGGEYYDSNLDPLNNDPSELLLDSDGDGITNNFEIAWDQWFLDPFNPADANQDQDADNLSNLVEYQIGTDLNDWDTDGDKLSDQGEHTFGLNPTYADPNELLEDSDADGMTNNYEVAYSFDPFDSSDAANDYDSDGLNNLFEHDHSLDPSNPDMDGDGLLDIEVLHGLDPFNALPSDMVPDSDGDGMTNGYEVTNFLDPFDDTDKNLDRDNDGLSNHYEYINGLSAADWDTDGDGLDDGAETELGSDPAVADDLSSDDDGDGLSLLDEYSNGTNPTEGDSDGDGVNDGVEVAQGSNPLDASDNGIPPPAENMEEVLFSIGGDYASWEMTVTGLGPDDNRAQKLRMLAPDSGQSDSLKLHRGNDYEITMQHLQTITGQSTTWWCWEASVDGLPTARTYNDYDTTRRPGIAEHFTVGETGGSWWVDNQEGLLTTHVHMDAEDGANIAGTTTAFLRAIEIDLDLSQTTMTLKHDNLCELEIITDSEGMEFTEHEFEIRYDTGSTWYSLGTGTSMDWITGVAGNFTLRAKAKVDEMWVYSEEKTATVQFPSYSQITTDSYVAGQMNFQWQTTLAQTTSTQSRERGFWIFLDTENNDYIVSETLYGEWVSPTSTNIYIAFSDKPDDEPFAPDPVASGAIYPVASFHTHTPMTYSPTGWQRLTGPSSEDVGLDWEWGIPGVIYDYTGAPGVIYGGHSLNDPAQLYPSGPNWRFLP